MLHPGCIAVVLVGWSRNKKNNIELEIHVLLFCCFFSEYKVILHLFKYLFADNYAVFRIFSMSGLKLCIFLDGPQPNNFPTITRTEP
jgi:hypothetical protein